MYLYAAVNISFRESRVRSIHPLRQSIGVAQVAIHALIYCIPDSKYLFHPSWESCTAIYLHQKPLSRGCKKARQTHPIGKSCTARSTSVIRAFEAHARVHDLELKHKRPCLANPPQKKLSDPSSSTFPSVCALPLSCLDVVYVPERSACQQVWRIWEQSVGQCQKSLGHLGIFQKRKETCAG